MPNDNLEKAYLLIDQENGSDPNTENVNGQQVPKELIYGQRMSDALRSFDNNASVALKLAARAQHICRWQIPRDSYPLGRLGYLKWREELKKFHAQKASEILEKVGYDESTIKRVSFLIQKKKLKKDEETQTLEDVICLVFLSHYFEEFCGKHPDEKIIDIITKTWKKMSEKGQQTALKITYSKKALDLIKQALG